MESNLIPSHDFRVQDNSKLMEKTRAELLAKKDARPSPWTWTFTYIGSVLVLFSFGFFWFLIFLLITHFILGRMTKKRMRKLRRNQIKSRFSRH